MLDIPHGKVQVARVAKGEGESHSLVIVESVCAVSSHVSV